MTDLAKLVGEDAEHLWNWMDYHNIYYKDNTPFGVIGVKVSSGISFVYSMSDGNRHFTKSMLGDMKKIYDLTNCAFVFKIDSSTYKKIHSILNRLGCEFINTEEHSVAYNNKE